MSVLVVISAMTYIEPTQPRCYPNTTCEFVIVPVDSNNQQGVFPDERFYMSVCEPDMSCPLLDVSGTLHPAATFTHYLDGSGYSRYRVHFTTWPREMITSDVHVPYRVYVMLDAVEFRTVDPPYDILISTGTERQLRCVLVCLLVC